jgi:glutamate-5-semialdehyde dehydrogenase
METLLIDRAIASEYLPEITDQLLSADVEVRVDQRGQEILKDQKSAIKKATEEDWTTEYLDRILSIRIVEDIEQAIDHINQYGSGHSDTIVTTSREKAERFMEGVDSAAVYWNASTRFTDGAEFGMGAEIGISTDKIGARGPMGLNELTSYKWLGYGTGQIRT